ncbi:helix-turn-helix domain-containing protein [candidate division KSB1 bacterium]
MNTGENIRARRRALGLTLEETAHEAGMQASNLSDIETSKRDVRTQTLERIARALKCPASELIEYVYEYEGQVIAGLQELIDDEKTRRLMSITEEEIEWMRSIRFRPNQRPTKEDFIDLLFIYRKI